MRTKVRMKYHNLENVRRLNWAGLWPEGNGTPTVTLLIGKSAVGVPLVLSPISRLILRVLIIAIK